MSDAIFQQNRAIDPFSSYFSNNVNKITKIVSKDQNCLLGNHYLDCISNDSTSIILLTGFCLKDDVLIECTSNFNINMTDSDFYIVGNGIPPFTEVGYYYIVLDYTNNQVKPAPQASIKILNPSEQALLTSSYLFLKAVEVSWNGATFQIDDVHDYDPDNPSIKREFSITNLDTEFELPSTFVQIEDEGRLKYIKPIDKIFVGTQNCWVDTNPVVDTYDTTNCSIGQPVYVKNDEKCYPAIATSFSTLSEAIVLYSGTNGKVQLTGRINNVQIETGISINVNDNVFLSENEAGTITNVEPAISQHMGVCVDIGDSTSTCSLWFLGISSLDAKENLWDRVALTSTLVPHTANDNVDLGSGNFTTTGNITGGRLDIDNIRIDGNTISSLDSDGDIILSPDSTGEVVIGSGEHGIDYVLRFDGETNDGLITWKEDEDTFEMACNLEVTENIYADRAEINNIRIDGNTISSLDSDGDIILSPDSTGEVVIGSGESGIDYTLRFHGESNDGLITWKEDEDKFEMDCDLEVTGKITSNEIDISGGTLTLADDQISGDKVEGGTINSISISNLNGEMDCNYQTMYNVQIDFGIVHLARIARIDTERFTTNYDISTNDFGKSLRMDSANDRIFTLSDSTSSEDGARVTCVKINSGKLTIQASGLDCIADGDPGNSIYNDKPDEDYATITLEFVAIDNKWVVIGAHGTWVTT